MDETIQKFDKEIGNTKVKNLVNIISEFPKYYQDDLFEGVKFSFSDKVTQKLDEKLFIEFKKQIKKQHLLK